MKTGVEYYKRFVNRFPSINKLAEAEQKELYSLWEGLGYYNRASNLHKTAKIITEQYNGVFPKTYDELIKLPGVGKYTASAISSICYNEKRVVVDANVFRVLARVFNIKTNINKAKAYNSFLDLSNKLAKKTINTGDYNEAIMDFGSTVCSPKKPACYKCVFNSNCEANSKGIVDLLPVKSTKKKTIKRDFNYYVFENKKNLLIKKEPKVIFGKTYMSFIWRKAQKKTKS